MRCRGMNQELGGKVRGSLGQYVAEFPKSQALERLIERTPECNGACIAGSIHSLLERNGARMASTCPVKTCPVQNHTSHLYRTTVGIITSDHNS